MEALDDLAERATDLETVLAGAAALLRCAVGVRLIDGTTHPPDAVAPGPGHRRTLPDGTEVWLVPDDGSPLAGDPEALAVALRRFGVAVRVGLLQSMHRGRATDLHTVLDPGTSDADRLPALTRLGLPPTAAVTLVALAGPADGVARVVEQIRAQAPVAHHTHLDRVHVVIARDYGGATDLRVPVGVRCAFTADRAPLHTPETWQRTRNALRFALPSTHEAGPYEILEATVVDSTTLGAYAALAENLTAEALGRIGDVQRLDQLTRETGPEMLPTLLAVASTDSLRRAAALLHVHHNSVAHRLRRAERVLGFGCTEPYGRARLLLVVTLHRLLESWKHF